jgi:hypothetical protein
MRTLAFLIILFASTAARAEEVGVVVTGEATMQPQLVAQIEGWLKRHGHQLVPAPLSPDAVNTLIDCFVIEDEACARRVIEKRAKAKAVVYARVDIQPGGDLEKTVTVLAYWFEKGHPAVAERRFCERCSDPSLRKTTDELMIALDAVGHKDGKSQLKLTSTPAGARVVIDGKPAGVTPYDQEVAPGPHELTIELDGRESETRFVTAKASEPVVLEVPLTAAGGRSKQLPPLVVMGAGAALFVTGAVMLAIDQDRGPDQPPEIRNTGPTGVAFAVAGLAAAAGGYVWYRSVGKHESAPVAAVTHEGAYIGWLGRF